MRSEWPFIIIIIKSVTITVVAVTGLYGIGW